METLGERFARSLAAKDSTGIRAVLADEVDFKGLTPGRAWEASEPDEILDILLGTWFAPEKRIDDLLTLTVNDTVADTDHVGYRFAITMPDGPHVAEQQAYYRGDGERITYLRVLCSGIRPVG